MSQRYPHLDIDTTYIYGKLNRRRKAYRREQFAKRVCPALIFVSTMCTLGYLVATRMF
jgi:hypothetical protein